jgi:hypothetical protein
MSQCKIRRPSLTVESYRRGARGATTAGYKKAVRNAAGRRSYGTIAGNR